MTIVFQTIYLCFLLIQGFTQVFDFAFLIDEVVAYSFNYTSMAWLSYS